MSLPEDDTQGTRGPLGDPNALPEDDTHGIRIPPGDPNAIREGAAVFEQAAAALDALGKRFADPDATLLMPDREWAQLRIDVTDARDRLAALAGPGLAAWGSPELATAVGGMIERMAGTLDDAVGRLDALWEMAQRERPEWVG